MLEKLKASSSIIIITTIMAFVCLILAVFFLHTSKFSMNSLLLLDLYAIKELLLSSEFWLFVLFFSLANGLFMFIFERFERRYAIMSSVIGSSLAVLLSLTLFKPMQRLIIVFVFYIVGLVVAEEFVRMRLTELKKLRALRAASAGMSKLIVIMSLGLLVAGILIIMPQQEKYEKKFNQMFVKTLFKAGASTTANAVVEGQRYIVQEILNSKQFMAIRSSSSPEDQNFALYLGTFANKVFSKKYRENAVKQVEKTVGNEKFIENVTAKMPLGGTLKKVLFVALPLNSALMFWFFGQVILKNIGAVFAALIAIIQRT